MNYSFFNHVFALQCGRICILATFSRTFFVSSSLQLGSASLGLFDYCVTGHLQPVLICISYCRLYYLKLESKIFLTVVFLLGVMAYIYYIISRMKNNICALATICNVELKLFTLFYIIYNHVQQREKSSVGAVPLNSSLHGMERLCTLYRCRKKQTRELCTFLPTVCIVLRLIILLGKDAQDSLNQHHQRQHQQQVQQQQQQPNCQQSRPLKHIRQKTNQIKLLCRKPKPQV